MRRFTSFNIMGGFSLERALGYTDECTCVVPECVAKNSHFSVIGEIL